MNPVEIVQKTPAAIKTADQIDSSKFYAYIGVSNVDWIFYISIIGENPNIGWSGTPLFNSNRSSGSKICATLSEKIEDILDKGFRVLEFNTELDRARWIVSQIKKQ